jgi:hypothetical protein
MIKIRGNLQMPENLFDLITVIQKKEKPKLEGYLGSFERLVDPVLICTLFGLFKSQELPPVDIEEYPLPKSHEFNVDISSFAETLNHFLFCLWVKKNGTPDSSKDIVLYRETLYKFISKLLDTDYYRNVLIPFYLYQAERGEESGTSSFTHRLASSDNVPLVLEDYSPEFLAREFSTAQGEFINNIIGALDTTN